MRFLIIGLGIYGTNLALDLTAMGHEVVGVDRNPLKVEEIKDSISAAYVADTSEETQIAVLPLLNVDLVIVAIGENFGASIKTVALLKKNGTPHIYARAIDTLHEAILKSFEIDRIITPEQRAAFDLTHELELGSTVRTLTVDADTIVISFAAPDYLLGRSYPDLAQKLAADFSLQLIAATRPEERTNVLGIKRTEPKLIDLAGATCTAGDILTLFGPRRSLRNLAKKIAPS